MSAPDKWLEFASRDLDGAEVLFEKARYHLACYLSQQAAEKALKAFLAKHLKRIPHIHELDEIHKRCSQIDSSFQSILQHCLDLTIFFNPVRYPDAEPGILPEGFPTREQAEAALNKAKEVIDFVRQRLAQLQTPQNDSSKNPAE
jgi:HEPN domain-containing protein